ncbi:MAG: sigma 54-interacting transcriptional regulator [Myxococcota bacterium]
MHAFFGPGKELVARLTKRRLVIGRGNDCDGCIDDPAASRRHLALQFLGGALQIEDLQSHNGTFVNGTPVDTFRGDPPAIIRVGTTLLCVSRDDGERPDQRTSSLVGGASLALLRRQIHLVSPTSLAVLILGETGTGKELVAREIHARSGRKGPFVVANCPALPEALAESELFGHARASFTGATAARTGLIASAAGGTLFLDEVADLPLPVQAKLLRVLEDGRVRAVGSDEEHFVDVRIVSATNRDLVGGQFREDLLARLANVTLQTVPLRERIKDLPALCKHLLHRAGRSAEITPDAMEALALHRWPMNVRELDSALQTAALATTGSLDLASLPGPLRDRWEQARAGTLSESSPASSPDASPGDSEETRDALDRLKDALRAHEGNVSAACESAGISRSHGYRLIQRHGLNPDRFRKDRRGT